MRACAGLAVLIGLAATAFACSDDTATSPAAPPDAGPLPDSGATDGGGAFVPCPTTTSGPTAHDSTITADETWTADKSPHVIDNDLAINATVTIEPCAEVRIAAATSITVSGGKLVAIGREGNGIRIHASDPTKPFAQIATNNGGTLRLAYVDIEDGGDPTNIVPDVIGTIRLQGADATAPVQPTLFVDHVNVKDSRSLGVVLQDGAGFDADSRDLTVTGSANFAMSIAARALSGVPTGTYTGNTVDEIVVPCNDVIQEDTTIHDRGVPYRIGNSLTNGYLKVEKPVGLATLTIEPGVTLRFKKDAELIVEGAASTDPARGALIAQGTAAKPIVFTSAAPTPAAGDWIGISFNSVPNPNDKLDNVRVEWAGGLTGSGSDTCNISPVVPDAAIRVRGVPSGQFVTNTVIANSAAHGIDRGWRNDAKTDFIATNTFTAVAACKQTYPKDTNGACPDPVPCPQ